MSESPAETAKQRLEAMLGTPFGQQIMRDLVPRGAQITLAAPTDLLGASVRRAMDDSLGLPAFLAIAEPGREDVTILIAEASEEPGSMRVRRPGDWAPAGVVSQSMTLTECIEQLRRANEGNHG